MSIPYKEKSYDYGKYRCGNGKKEELAERIGITAANLSILKNNKAKAVRFSTLEAICRELNCQVADILEYIPDEN